MTRKTEGVRIGPVSLVTLISILLLAVLAMLCITSAHAAQTMAERQANSNAESYALDAAGQHLLADVDAELASTNGSWKAVHRKLAAIAHDIRDTSSLKNPAISTKATKDGISFAISASSGKSLEAQVSTNKDGSLSIDEWKLTTTQQETEETLWSGSSDN